MGLYSRFIAPRLAERVCARSDVAAERRALVPRAVGVVVEIGIGSGLNLTHYDASRVTQVFGVDPGDGFLALGTARFDNSPVPVKIMRAPAEAIPLGDNVADTAVMTYALCSVDDPLQVLRELRRVLVPGGALLFLEHGRSPDALVARWQDRLNRLWKPISVGCNLNRDVPALLVKAGFAIEDIVRFDLPGAPRLIGAHVRGLARSA